MKARSNVQERSSYHSDADALQAFISQSSTSDTPKKKGAPHVVNMFFRPFLVAHRVPVFKRVWLYMAAMAFYTYAADWIAQENFPSTVFKEFNAVSSTGIILGLLLVFRTNSAYERWWEGRKLWGQLVNDSRNLCLKIRAIDSIHVSDRNRFGELLVSFAYALKHRLRETVPTAALPGVGFIPPEAKNVPVFVAGKMINMLSVWRKEGLLDIATTQILDSHASAFMNICGACERIKNSPIAVSYRAFMRQGIALNLLAMPWYLSQHFSVWWSMPLTITCTYFLVGIELIAEDIEDPFGHDGDDLPLDNICAGIKDSVSQILELTDSGRYTQSMTIPNNQDLLKF